LRVAIINRKIIWIAHTGCQGMTHKHYRAGKSVTVISRGWQAGQKGPEQSQGDEPKAARVAASLDHFGFRRYDGPLPA
jgi:hypothetical protein